MGRINYPIYEMENLKKPDEVDQKRIFQEQPVITSAGVSSPQAKIFGKKMGTKHLKNDISVRPFRNSL